jgi:hypothetical protein
LKRSIDDLEFDTQKPLDAGAGAFACWDNTSKSEKGSNSFDGKARSEQDESNNNMAAVAAALILSDIGR